MKGSLEDSGGAGVELAYKGFSTFSDCCLPKAKTSMSSSDCSERESQGCEADCPQATLHLGSFAAACVEITDVIEGPGAK